MVLIHTQTVILQVLQVFLSHSAVAMDTIPEVFVWCNMQIIGSIFAPQCAMLEMVCQLGYAKRIMTPACCCLCLLRFLRHFSMLCIPPPSDASTKTILSSILGGFLADFPTDVKALGSSVVNASVEAYNR